MSGRVTEETRATSGGAEAQGRIRAPAGCALTGWARPIWPVGPPSVSGPAPAFEKCAPFRTREVNAPAQSPAACLRCQRGPAAPEPVLLVTAPCHQNLCRDAEMSSCDSPRSPGLSAQLSLLPS